MLAIVNYKAGNQTSVQRALTHLGIESEITDDARIILDSSGIIFPGVGAAPQAMTELRLSGLDKVLARAIEKGVPLLGICLGCQILLEHSEEGPTKTLGFMPGCCKRFQDDWQDGKEPIQIPHMGWNSIKIIRPSPLLTGIPAHSEFYFVHSYYVEPHPDQVIATTSYGREFCSIYGRDNLWALQFHPEKSGAPGLAILNNFNEITRRGHAF